MNTSTVIGSSLSSVSGIDGFLIIHVEWFDGELFEGWAG
jgi:hypothetical protein